MEVVSVIRCGKGLCQNSDHALIDEEPLLIRVDDRPYSVVMRTPGEEVFHAAGFCIGEGIADSAADFASIGFCKDLDPNVVEVRLKPQRAEKIGDILDRRGFLSQTSCGICGKAMIQDLYQILKPARDGVRIAMDHIFRCSRQLEETQVYYNRTRGSHAAMIFDFRLRAVAFAEDVGRHNALDKAIGKFVLKGGAQTAAMVILTSRISYELVQKAARAHLPIVVGKSRPTALAVEMGKMLNMTLACHARASELTVYCGKNRIDETPRTD